MEQQTSTPSEETINPLDSVEDLLNDHNWVYNRMNSDELIVQVTGNACDYRLLFVWQEHMSALQFCCQYEMEIHDNNIPAANAAIMDINSSLWMGHFEIDKENRMPAFRHTCLLRGRKDAGNSEYVEDLVDISLVQCERYHSLFHILSLPETAPEDSLSLALMDTLGES